MTDKKAERYDDLANRFGTEAAQRIVDAEFAEELDLENHEGIQQLKAWREDKNEQKRMEQQQREKERQQALEAQAQEELRATKARMKERYVKAGGSPEEFEQRAWSKLREEVLHKKALEAEETYSAIR